MRVLISVLFLMLAACAPEQSTGPAEVRWDRDVCARCNMAVSDRHYAAQLRGAAAGERTRLYKFDDLGCAVIWLEQQDWKDDPRTEIWVTDYESGEWLDAREASYVTERISPMNYGLGAQSPGTENSLDYAQAIAHIMAAEKDRHMPGGRKPVTEE